MVEGKTPAPWFVEVNGQKQGPYTSQQIMKLLMDGALKVESRIFDSAANSWKIAADVIPYLDVNERPSTRSWQPPPRPPELKDVHIVDLNRESTGEVDYFALINDRRREVELARLQAARIAASSNRQPQAEGRRGQQGSPGRNSLNEARKMEASKIIRVAPPVDETPQVRAAGSRGQQQQQALGVVASAERSADGVFSAEVVSTGTPVVGPVIALGHRARSFVSRHKSAISVAAGLCFVFVGTYGVVRTVALRNARVPASAPVEQPEAAADPIRSIAPKEKIRMSADDTLGSGRNPVKRGFGGLGKMSAPAPIATQAPPAQDGRQDPPRDEPPRDPPQYFSSANDGGSAVPPPNLVPAPTPDNVAVNPSANANEGVVQPPAFNPPPEVPGDPARVPSNDGQPVITQ